MTLAFALALLAVLGIAAPFMTRVEWGHAVVHGGAAICCTVLTFVAFAHSFGSGATLTWSLPLGLPWIGANFALDALSSFFLIVVNLSGAVAGLFGVGYASHVPEPRRVTPLFPLFLAGMNLVLLAADAFTFLVAWEFMSLTSWLLVLSDHRRAETRAAGLLYLIMAAFGTMCLLAVFGLLGGATGQFGFAAMRSTGMSDLRSFLVVLLVILGTGSKAGLVPLHAWLPQAHPAAPSHVSALMSGVMTKVALYALVRLLFDLHGEVPWGWGVALMVIGALTAVIGVLYALMQRDLKTLLAYSTVENVGIIVVALGLALAFKGRGELALATLAVVAALYHALNHSLFKSLLFLGSGAVLMATGSRDLDRLGGLLKRMPVTGWTFLIGAAAISALPPLNGFVSEWLILQSLFRGPTVADWTMRFGVPVVGVLFALAAALAAACFVRAYGVAFLGRPRSAEAEKAEDPPLSMRVALMVLAGGCILLGVFPVTMTGMISVVAEPLTGVQLPTSAGLGWPWLSPISDERGSYSATLVTLSGLALLLTSLIGVRLFGSTRTRRAPAWDCGHNEAIVNAQYTAASFSQPLRRVFGSTLFAAREQVEMPRPGDPSPARITVSMRDPIWDFLYVPTVRAIGWIADRVNRLQYLTVRRYLLLMFLTLVLMLLIVAGRQ